MRKMLMVTAAMAIPAPVVLVALDGARRWQKEDPHGVRPVVRSPSRTPLACALGDPIRTQAQEMLGLIQQRRQPSGTGVADKHRLGPTSPRAGR
jgi:hypothetical protein